MAIQSVKNQFRGINPHLHSYWQATDSWNEFHNVHITYVLRGLKRLLLPRGYTLRIEDSIQIRREWEDPQRLRSDLTIYDLDMNRATLPPAVGSSQASGMVLALPVLMEMNPISEKPYRAVAVFKVDERRFGRPVAWIEVLSPSNKRWNEDGQTYLRKRNELLNSGVVFVELDYLHEIPPTFPLIPDYTVAEPHSHPYRIIVLDPRPTVKQGQAAIHEFDLDDPIPTVRIPLSADEFVDYSFDEAYQAQFEELLHGIELDVVDYSRLPLNFDRYSPADQLRIVTRLLTVKHAAERGEDLEQAPLPLIEAPASIETGLAALGVG